MIHVSIRNNKEGSVRENASIAQEWRSVISRSRSWGQWNLLRYCDVRSYTSNLWSGQCIYRQHKTCYSYTINILQCSDMLNVWWNLWLSLDCKVPNDRFFL